MGMYDSFYFAEGVLPDNKEPPNEEFQTKCLECNLRDYYVSSDFILTEKSGIDCSNFTESLIVYSHNFEYDPSRSQYYKIVFIKGKLIHAEKAVDCD
jgi:hypothetical protein